MAELSLQYEMNDFGLPVGLPIAEWHAPSPPAWELLIGRFCRVEPLRAECHGVQLYDMLASSPVNWSYLPYGPFGSQFDMFSWIVGVTGKADPLLYAIVDASTNLAVGIAAYLRIFPADGTIEVGHLNYSPLLKRTPAATEAMYLMMRNVFALGYRRYEWKCNALNEPSRRAAQRLGFSFEGVWRQAKIVKARNRDTAWFALIDQDWPLIDAAFQAWLSKENFDEHGKQLRSLSELTRPLLAAVDPCLCCLPDRL